MRRLIPFRIALVSTMLILVGISVFHVLIITSVIPYDIVWGGRLSSREEMLGYEAISLALNVFMLVVLAIRGGWLQLKVSGVVIRVIIWFMFALFTLNTIGNLLSNNELERIIFTPLTVLLAVFCLRLALPTRSANS